MLCGKAKADMNRRSTLITSAAIAGVMLVGTTAVAANIGILNTADDDPIGELSAAADVTTIAEPAPIPTAPEAQVIDVYIDEPVPSTLVSEAAPDGQEFAVDDAGAVTIERTGSGIRVGEVAAEEGWTWSSAQTSENELSIEFVSGDASYVFYASLAPDGTIDARVDQPIVRTVQVAAPPAPAFSSAPAAAPPAGSTSDFDDDDYDDDDYDDDDYDDDDDDDERDEDEEDEDEEDEGGDDDD